MSQVVQHLSLWRNATILPQRNSFLRDLIPRVFMRSIQYGLVVLGFFDAFHYAHHKQCQDSENSGNFGDCMHNFRLPKTIVVGGIFIQMVVLALLMVKLLLGGV